MHIESAISRPSFVLFSFAFYAEINTPKGILQRIRILQSNHCRFLVLFLFLLRCNGHLLLFYHRRRDDWLPQAGLPPPPLATVPRFASRLFLEKGRAAEMAAWRLTSPSFNPAPFIRKFQNDEWLAILSTRANLSSIRFAWGPFVTRAIVGGSFVVLKICETVYEPV